MALCSQLPYVGVSRHRPMAMNLGKTITSTRTSIPGINPISYFHPFHSRAVSTISALEHHVDEPRTLKVDDDDDEIVYTISSSFNHLIAELYLKNQHSSVVTMFGHMFKARLDFDDYRPRTKTMNLVVDSYSRLKSVELGFEDEGLPSTFESPDHLIEELHQKGRHSDVIFMFNQMIEGLGLVNYRPRMETLKMVIESYCCLNNARLGFCVLSILLKQHGMDHGRKSDPRNSDRKLGNALSILIKGLCREGCYEKAIELFHKMVVERFHVDCSFYFEAVELFQEMVENEHPLNHASCYMTMFHALYLVDISQEAVKLIKKALESGLIEPSIEMLNQMIDILNLNEHVFDKALEELCRYMIMVRGVIPNSKTYNSLFQKFLPRMDDDCLLIDMLEHGLLPDDTEACNNLVQIFCEPAQMDRTRVAIMLLGSMIRRGIEPDSTTFHYIIFSLYRIGQSDRAEKYIDSMSAIGISLLYHDSSHSCDTFLDF